MTDRIKVDLDAAADFAAKGFTVECYVLIAPTPVKPTKARQRTYKGRVSPLEALDSLMISAKGTPPTRGDLLEAYNSVMGRWDLTSTFTVADLTEHLQETVNEDYTKARQMVSDLVHRYHVIRKVEAAS